MPYKKPSEMKRANNKNIKIVSKDVKKVIKSFIVECFKERENHALTRIHTGRVVGQMTAQIGPYNLLWCRHIC